MLDMYMELPGWLRTTIALVVLCIGVTLTIIGYRGPFQRTEQPLPNGRVLVTEGEDPGARSSLRFGMVCSGVGVILLLTCGKSSAEKNGYNF